MTNNPEAVEVPVTQADYALVHQVCVNHGNHDYQAQLAARHRLGHSPAGGEGEDYDALHLKVAQALFRQSGSFEIGLKVSEADELATAAIAALHTQTPDTVRERVWHPIAEAPHACHVLACRFDGASGEYIMGVVASPPTKPFTHFMMLPEGPKP